MKKVLLYIIYSIFTFFSFALNSLALSNITLSPGSLVPYFNKTTYKYNVYLDKEVKEINITTALEENDSYVEGSGNIKLELGENSVVLKLFEKDGNVKTYTLKIFRGEMGSADSSNSLLKKLVIKDYNLNFDSNTFSYNINILDENELDIDYEPFNNNSNIKLDGNSNLESGNNKIIITVTSEDKSNKSVYEINVNKTETVFKEDNDKKNDDSYGYVLNQKDKIIIKVAIVLVITIIITGLYYLFFIYGHKKKKRKKK